MGPDITNPEPAADPLLCPLCDYNLHGLPEPRCPECGYAFDWEELRLAVSERKSWFFEHAQRKRIRALIRTAGLTFAPRRLWRKVSAGHYSSPGRLAVFAAVCLLWMPVLMVLSLGAIAAYIGWANMTGFVAGTKFADYVEEWLNLASIAGERLYREVLNRAWPVLLVVTLASPFVSSFALNIFGTTLRSAGVKRIHAARAIVYAWCPFLLTVGVLNIVLWTRDSWRWDLWVLLQDYRSVVDWIELLGPVEVVMVMLGMFAWSGWCVRQAIKHYLRLPQATTTAVLTHSVTLLVALLIATLGVSYWRGF
jgi:hypothetical protein